MKIERMFPIQGEHFPGDVGLVTPASKPHVQRPAGQVPWGIAELAYAEYVKVQGYGQSLEKLAERGGFGWTELVRLLQGKRYHGDHEPIQPGRLL